MRASLFALFAAAIAQTAPAATQQSYRMIAQLPAGDGGWDLASVDAGKQRLYVARSDGVTAIDLKSGKTTDRIVSGHRVHAALAIPGTHDVISTNGETNNAILFDGSTGKIRATIPTGTKPDAATYDPATKTVWIMNPGSGDITVINPATAQVLATVPIGGSLELGAADGHGRLYVNIEDKNEVAVIDTVGRKVLAHFPLEGCDGPTGIAYDNASRQLLSACANGVAIVSTPDGRQVGRLPIGKGADGAAYDARRRLVLVPAGRDGNLTLIRLQPVPEVVGRVTTTVSARTIALDPTTGRVYLPSARLGEPVGNERPKAVPGTFRVLVLAPSK